MSISKSCIRDENIDFNYGIVYDEFYKEFFSLEIHHGGVFAGFPSRTYKGGQVTYVDFIEINKFNHHDLNMIMKKLGIEIGEKSNLFYHFKIPGSDLDIGLRGLGNDAGVRSMMEYVPQNRCISVYIEHGKTTILNYGVEERDVASTTAEKVGYNTVFEDQNEVKWATFFDHSGADFNEVEDVLGDELEYEDQVEKDELVDEENDEEEVEVDMKSFKVNFNSSTQVDETIPVYETVNDVDEEIVDDDSFDSGSDDEVKGIERIRKRKIKALRKERQAEQCVFYVGQQFGNKEEIKKLVKKHSVETRRELKLYRNDQVRLRVICNGPIPQFINTESPSEGPSQKDGGRKTVEPNNKCPWLLYASKMNEEPTWVVKTYNPEHKCLQTRSVKAFTAEYMSKEILMQIESNPCIPLQAIQEQMHRKFEMKVSRMKAFRAKTQAMDQVMGDYVHQYSILRDYGLELMRTNPGTTVKIEVQSEPNPASETRVFRRIYVCLGPLKLGFKACKRDLIGLDGAFMKGPFPGQLLTAVGVDPNNGIYPVAYAIVEAENASSWSWFLDNLGEDLELQSNHNFTFISDRQKGIIPALSKKFPNAEHRFCLRHIHQNIPCIRFTKHSLMKLLIWTGVI